MLAVYGCGGGLHGDGLRDEGIVLQRILAHADEVDRAGVVVVVLEAVGIHEMRVRHAELGRLLVHDVGKGLNRPRDADREVMRGVVGGIHEHDLQQLPHGGLVAVDIARHLRILVEGRGSERNDLVEGDAGVEHAHGGHDLGDGCQRHVLLGVLLVHHVAALVDERRARGLRKRGRRYLLGVCLWHLQQENCRKRRDNRDEVRKNAPAVDASFLIHESPLIRHGNRELS